MRLFLLCFLFFVLFFNVLGLKAETLVEGVVAIVLTDKSKPGQEVLFFSDLERYRLFFKPLAEVLAHENEAALKEGEGLKESLRWMIAQKFFKKEALRFGLKRPTEQEIEIQLEVIRQRFSDEEDFQNALKQAGLTDKALKKEVFDFLWVEKLIKERIREFIFISPKEVVKYYLDHLTNFSGSPFEEFEAEIEQILSKQKEELKKSAYLNRIKEKGEIKIMFDGGRPF